MKKFILPLIEELHDFIIGKERTPKPEKPIDPKVLTTIEKALAKKASVHIIYQQNDFIGHILKFDRAKSQLVIENIKGSITMIIHLKEIHKISILPVALTKESQI